MTGRGSRKKQGASASKPPEAAAPAAPLDDEDAEHPDDIVLEYSPFPKQKEFHECEAEVVLFGGAAGPGKSTSLINDVLRFVTDHPGSTAMLMRRKYPELEKSLIKKMRLIVPPELGRYNDSKHRWTIFCGEGHPDSYIEFGHCERANDVYDYLSAEWEYLGIDESTSFSKEMFDMLYGRVRTTRAGVKPRVRLCSNPGNIGHGWHKEFFGIGRADIKPGTVWRPPKKPEDEYDPPTRCFIPAVIFDNPALIKTDPGYLARLENLPDARKRMYLHGEWTGYAGQFFAEFDSKKHVVPPREVPRHWKRHRSVDFGYQKPFSCHWYAVDEMDTVWVYREVYRTGLRDTEQAQAIKRNSVYHDGSPEYVEYSVGDPSMMQKDKNAGITTQQRYHVEGVIVFPGSNARVAGWNAVRNLLAINPKTNKPYLQVFSTCENLIRELEEALFDESNPEDLNTDGSDHALDDLRYFAMSRPQSAEALKKEDPRSRLDAASRAEWDSVAKLQDDAARAAKGGRSVLNGFNGEDF